MTPQFTTAHKLIFGMCLLALVLPFLAVEIPPITDLPQQVAQMRLLQDASQQSDSVYRIQWWEPNKLGYLPLWIAWQVASPLNAGRLALSIIGTLWILAIIDLARRRRRSLPAATLACLFFFNHALYWGLLNFLVGLPVFILWLGVLAPPESAPRSEDTTTPWPLRRWLGLMTIACLLYSAHALWLAAGVAYLIFHGLVSRFDRRRWWIHLSALSPVALATAIWYPQLAQRGFDSETFWALGQRWHYGWWVNSAFGGLKGSTETWLAACVLAWLLLGLLSYWQNKRRHALENPEETLDIRLLIVALGCLAAALLLPGVYQNTVFFASRWLPVGVVFLLLAVPPPKLQRALRMVLPILLFATLSVTTTDAWLTFDRQELDGLHDALQHIEGEPNVLGLDFVRTSESIQGYPYYHLYGWSQVLHGGELARSFANEASSLVVYDDLPRQQPWTEGLDWRARKLRRPDIDHFDYVILHGDSEMQRLFFADPRLTAITPPRRWCLFRVQAPISPQIDPPTGSQTAPQTDPQIDPT